MNSLYISCIFLSFYKYDVICIFTNINIFYSKSLFYLIMSNRIYIQKNISYYLGNISNHEWNIFKNIVVIFIQGFENYEIWHNVKS